MDKEEMLKEFEVAAEADRQKVLMLKRNMDKLYIEMYGERPEKET